MKDQCICDPAPCQDGLFERPRYFPRQLVTPEDMTLAQDYLRNKWRLHNRMLLGWGVVCGARVCLKLKSDGSEGEYEAWTVQVKPGFILGPYGDEIAITCTHDVDLRGTGVTGAPGEPSEQAADPWCSTVDVQREASELFVAVRYKEVLTRPVRVQPVGCGCEETQCEYSRWRDCYEIGILTECPTSHVDPPESDALFSGDIPECPECPDDPWVVLAKVPIDPNGIAESIDNCSCRRLVASFGKFWWKCTGNLQQSTIRFGIDILGTPTVDETSKFILDLKDLRIAHLEELNSKYMLTLDWETDDGETGQEENVETEIEATDVPGTVSIAVTPGTNFRAGRHLFKLIDRETGEIFAISESPVIFEPALVPIAVIPSTVGRLGPSSKKTTSKAVKKTKKIKKAKKVTKKKKR